MDKEAGVSQAVQEKEAQIQEFVGLHAMNNEATNDIMNSLIFDSFEFDGKERATVRGSNGQLFTTDESLLDYLIKTRPSYLETPEQKRNIEANKINVGNHIEGSHERNIEYLDDILSRVESGEIRTLSLQEKDNLRKILKAANENKYGVIKIGGRSLLECTKVFRKIKGGLF